VKPKVLFVTEFISYKQKVYSLAKNINEIVESLPTVEKVVVIERLKKSDEFLTSEKFVSWEGLLITPTDTIEFEPCPFDHPLFILFSSGTTGVPKCLVHSVGGMLLKHYEEHVIQTNFNPADVVFFYTTCGWMMWNWLMSVLLTGATIVLYEESPLEPDPHILLKIASDTRATQLGAGAKIYDEYQKMDLDFKSLYNLDSLRLILSTASPLKASTFEFINTHIRPQVVIGSISGNLTL
jgi:acetoacetyl-CoA synthetase